MLRSNPNSWRVLAVVAVLAAAPRIALGVAVSGAAENGVSLVAPSNNPFWSNVTHVSTASGVYLGNRWMITADHVSDGAVTLSDGRSFGIVPGSDVTLVNPLPSGLAGNADLRMFQLTADPGLPSVSIGALTPLTGTSLMMIGAGLDRDRNQIGWQVTNTSSGLNWRQAPLPTDNFKGYDLLSTSHMRWGDSHVAGGLTVTSNSVVFPTTFSSIGPFSAMAVRGDSGGGVFQSIGGTMSLVGIIDAQQLQANQPTNSIAYGNQSYIINLATYRNEILSVMGKPLPDWQNPLNPFDVNFSGSATPQDLLILINALRTEGAHALSGAPGTADSFVDVNGDGILDINDELTELKAIMNGSANNNSLSSNGGSASNVPEPSSAMLALAGLLLLALGRRAWLRCAAG